MKVEVWLDKLNSPIKFEALSTYEKGNFFCVQHKTKMLVVTKFPIKNIFRVVEEYEVEKIR